MSFFHYTKTSLPLHAQRVAVLVPVGLRGSPNVAGGVWGPDPSVKPNSPTAGRPRIGWLGPVLLDAIVPHRL